MKFSDSHFHSLFLDADLELGEFYDALYCGIDTATRIEDTQAILDNISNRTNIYTSIAAGPWCVRDTRTENDNIINSFQSLIEKYKGDKRVAAVGEIGLDYFHSDYASPSIQKEFFSSLLSLARDNSYPVILHIRDSFQDVFDIVKSCDISMHNIVHCFSSDIFWAKKFLDKGFYLSFGGSITYKSNDFLRECVKFCPLDRLLVETDSPYLSPHPKRGEKNTPLNIPIIIDKIAELKACSAEEVIASTNKNLMDFIAQRCG